MRPLGNAALYFQLRDLLVISISLLFFLFEKDPEVCLISPDAQGGHLLEEKRNPRRNPGVSHGLIFLVIVLFTHLECIN